MGNQENNKNSNSQNPGRRNHRFSKYKNNNKSTNGGNAGNSKSLVKKEMKFHLHDSEAQKCSESYDKIRKHIIFKI